MNDEEKRRVRAAALEEAAQACVKAAAQFTAMFGTQLMPDIRTTRTLQREEVSDVMRYCAQVIRALK